MQFSKSQIEEGFFSAPKSSKASNFFKWKLDVVKGELVNFDWEAQDNSKAKVSDTKRPIFFQKCQTENFIDKLSWHLVTMFVFVFSGFSSPKR